QPGVGSPCAARSGRRPQSFSGPGPPPGRGGLGDRAALLCRPRADRILVAVEENVEVRMLPLDLLDPLHDVLEGDRLVVRVDPHDNPLLALRPQGPPSALRRHHQFIRTYKYYSGLASLPYEALRIGTVQY